LTSSSQAPKEYASRRSAGSLDIDYSTRAWRDASRSPALAEYFEFGS
jgi:hypothetical protein